MKYSVIIPAFNCAGTIGNTVESIQKSGLPDCEIVVVDDGSTDGTVDRLEELSKQYGNIRIVSQKNGGVSSARNLGLQSACGDYILFVDADDLIEEGGLTHAAEILDQEKPDILIFGMTMEYLCFGKCYRKDTLVSGREGLLSQAELINNLRALFSCNYLTPVWNKLIRRELIVNHGIRFDESMHVMEDCLFSLQCLQYCKKVFLLSEALYHYVVPDDGRKAAERIDRIESLSAYIEQFSGLPYEYDRIVNEIYLMLLRQQIRNARSVKRLKIIAADCTNSSWCPEPSSASGTIKLLLTEDYTRILLRNMKSRLRHAAAVGWKMIKAWSSEPQSNY